MERSSVIRTSEISTNVRLISNWAPWVRAVEALSPRWAGVLLEHVFTRPGGHREPARAQAELMRSGRSFAFRCGQVELRGWHWGPTEGEPVLLVHGWQGRGAQLGALVQPLVSRGFRVVTFDAPAHGDSPGTTTNLVEFAEAIRCVAELCGPLRAVVAHSFGAAATTLALSSGLRVGCAVYLAPMSKVEPRFRRFADWMGASPRAMAFFIAELERDVGMSQTELELRLGATDRKEPLLILHDPNDREVPFSDGESLVARWPGARMRPLTGAGHSRLLSNEAAVGAAVEFIVTRS